MNQSKFKVNACGWHKASHPLYLRVVASHITLALSRPTARMCVTFFSAFFPANCWAKERETTRNLRESNKYTAVFSFIPDVHAQFTKYTRKPRELLARFEETHFGGRFFMSLTYLLTWPFVIHSQSQSRICWSKICLTVTPEWAVHSRPRYQDSVQVNTILFAQL